MHGRAKRQRHEVGGQVKGTSDLVFLHKCREALGSLRSDLVSEYSEEMEREAAYLGRELQQREHVVSQEVSERVRDSVAKEHLEELSAHRS